MSGFMSNGNSFLPSSLFESLILRRSRWIFDRKFINTQDSHLNVSRLTKTARLKIVALDHARFTFQLLISVAYWKQSLICCLFVCLCRQATLGRLRELKLSLNLLGKKPTACVHTLLQEVRAVKGKIMNNIQLCPLIAKVEKTSSRTLTGNPKALLLAKFRRYNFVSPRKGDISLSIAQKGH